jgi:surface protein
MFTSCSQLTQLSVSNWDTSKVTDMANIFNGCNKLILLDLSNWDTSNVAEVVASIFKPHTLLLNWSIEEINRFATKDIATPSIVYVKHDISKLTQNNKITYVKYISDEISISLPQPLRRIGDVCDRLYWDYDKGCYCIEKNIDIDENNELCIIEPVIIELTDMNKKIKVDVYETTKVGFIDTPINPTETIINQDIINYKIEQLESSTEYTIQFNCSAKIKENNIKIKINEEVIETPVTLGINKVKITTPSNITDKTRIVLYGEGNIIKDVMLFKGDLNQDLEYFEGIQGFGGLQEDGSYKITIVSDNYSWLWKE